MVPCSPILLTRCECAFAGFGARRYWVIRTCTRRCFTDSSTHIRRVRDGHGAETVYRRGPGVRRGVAPLVYLGLYDAVGYPVYSSVHPPFLFAALFGTASVEWQRVSVAPFLPRLAHQTLSACVPREHLSRHQTVDAATIVTSVPSHVAPTSTCQCINSYSAPQALPPLRRLPTVPIPSLCLRVGASRQSTCVHLNSARHHECVRGTLCLHHVASCIRCLVVDAARWHSAANLRRGINKDHARNQLRLTTPG